MIEHVYMPDDLQAAFEIAAIFCGALSGGLAGVRKNFDIFGVLLLAWATGLGGGLLRDVLIGATPPVGIADWRFVTAALAAGFVIFFFHPGLARMRRAVIVLDAGALAIFVVIGASKGIAYGVGPFAAVFVGMLTGIGGGLIRDLLVDEVPIVLRERELYAIPATVGAVAAVVLGSTGTLNHVTGVILVVMIFGLRLVSLKLRWSAPGPWQGFARASRKR